MAAVADKIELVEAGQLRFVQSDVAASCEDLDVRPVQRVEIVHDVHADVESDVARKGKGTWKITGFGSADAHRKTKP